MTQELFWPSLILVISACIFSFCSGFRLGRDSKERNDEDSKAMFSRETIRAMINEEIAKMPISQ